MYKMMTYNFDMSLADSRSFDNVNIALACAEFRNLGQTVLIIDTRTGKCVHYIW